MIGRRRFSGSPIDPVTGRHLDGRLFSVTGKDGAQIKGLVSGEDGSDDQATAVLVHCWTGERQHWDAVGTHLVRSGWRVITYDHRGHGVSDRGPSDPAIELLSDDLSLVLDHVGAGRVVVAGHSLGGAVGLHRAQAGDPRLGALVLAATSASFVAKPLRLFRRPVAGLIGSRGAERLVHGRAGRPIARSSLGKRPPATAVDRTLASLRNTDREVVGSHLAAIIRADLRPGLAGITVPTTVVVGTRDTLTPQRHARRMARSIPGAHLERLPGCGHMIPLERPDVLAAHIETTAGRAGLVPTTTQPPSSADRDSTTVTC